MVGVQMRDEYMRNFLRFQPEFIELILRTLSTIEQ